MRARFTMSESRTDGMSPSDVRNAIMSGELRLCENPAFSGVDPDRILAGMLQRGQFPKDHAPACLNLLSLGLSPYGMPLAVIERTAPDAARIETVPICTYCDSYCAGCLPDGGIGIYDILQDDPDWNAADMPEDD